MLNSGKWKGGYRSAMRRESASDRPLAALPANVLAGNFDKATFGWLPEFVISSGLFTDDESAAAVARIQPLCTGHCDTASAVEAHTGPQFHKRPALWKPGWLLELHLDQSGAQIVLQPPHRTHGDFVASLSLAHLPPVRRPRDQAS